MAATSRLSVERKIFKNQSLLLQEYISNTSSYEFGFISGYLDSIESSEETCVVEELGVSQWINCSRPLHYGQDLRGKLVLFDFFTYCCINCLHVLPTLREIEVNHSVADGLVIIGVHSAKFLNEKSSSNIERAAERYSIHHPIVNDSELIMWNEFGISCWPTFLLVSPTGRMLYVMIGETLVHKIPQLIDHVLRYYRERELILPHALPVCPGSVAEASYLKYPGKIHIDSESGLIFVSDTSHHRIVVLDSKSYSVASVIGCGRKGLKDGPTAGAEFSCPQGLASKGHILYVADTENHVVRKVDLEVGMVSTLCGTGRLGVDREGGGSYTEQEISSPWDLEIGGDSSQLLFVAMAGSHQIWVFFLSDSLWLKGTSYKAGTMLRFSGTGDEANRNNSYPHRACFAQPSGISINSSAGLLYIADSESGCVRSLSLKEGAVKGVVGGGLDPLDLFSYGDVDGTGRDARLQHPMGVAYNPKNDSVYVADAYNHKIKIVSVSDKSCVTLTGNGVPGALDGSMKEAQFFEPSGLSLDSARQILFVADTNNNAIRLLDLTAGTVRTLAIDSPVVPKPIELSESFNVRVGSTCSLIVNISIPESLKLNQESNWEIVIPSESSSCLSAPETKGHLSDVSVNQLTLSYSKASTSEGADALLRLSLQYCEGAACRIALRSYAISLQPDASCTEQEQTLCIPIDK